MMKKDISAKTLLALGALFLLFKLILAYGQSVYLYEPAAARLDDTLMLQSAMSIVRGEWLGAYNWLTLSKYMFFAVWLAGVHMLGIPYLIAGQLLWSLAALLCVAALAPVIRENKWRLVFFTVMLFNPAVSAAKVQLRVYRDNMFPALCTICVAGFIGAALRKSESIKKYIMWLTIGGIGLALSWVTREDGKWIAVFAIGATAVILIYQLQDKEITKKAMRIAALALPYAMTALIIMSFCILNYAYYGRFVLSDFTSREFNDAYGAMTRIKHENPRPKVAVPKDVRQKLYDNVPELAKIKPYLETDSNYNSYGSIEEQEFYSGGFYWVFRKAAAQAGVYDNAQSSKAYFENVAEGINALCDDGTLKASGRRSTTTPLITGGLVLPTFTEAFKNMGRVLIFSDTQPSFVNLTLGHAADITATENFLKEKSNSAAKPYTAESYYSPAQSVIYSCFNIISFVFSVLTPIGFLAGVLWQAKTAVNMFMRKKYDNLLMFTVMLGLILAAFLRCAMIGFMFVASFNESVERVMYLSSAHPIILIYSFMGIYLFYKNIKEKAIG